MSPSTLPPNPSLKSLKRQAKTLMRAHKAGKNEAIERLQAFHPRFRTLSLEAAKQAPLIHADALLVLAREYGFPSWAQLLETLDPAADRAPTNELPFGNDPGWEWLLAPNPDHPLGTNGSTAGNGCTMMYENRDSYPDLSVHIAVGTELITREWRLVALESEGNRHILTERGSACHHFTIALFGYRLPYSEIAHGKIQHLGIEALL